MSGQRLCDGDPEELIECPFDPIHILRRKRMPYHIIKCGKNFNSRDFKVCPFNSRHVVPKGELEAHLHLCQDRGILERELLHNQQISLAASGGVVTMQKGYTEVPVSTFVPPESSESWDDSNVVVDIAAQGSLFSNKEPMEKESALKSSSPKKPPSRVRDPPQPRMPIMTGAGGSEAFNLATTQMSSKSPPSRGRGRGRGTFSSPPKTGGLSGLPQLVDVASPRGVGLMTESKVVKLGRGRGAVLQAKLDAQSVISEEDELEAEKRKKEKKLKKMLRQIVELERKVDEGLALNEDQEAKLARKEDILSMLEQFHL